mgnify:CR=1 FL=1
MADVLATRQLGGKLTNFVGGAIFYCDGAKMPSVHLWGEGTSVAISKANFRWDSLRKNFQIGSFWYFN